MYKFALIGAAGYIAPRHMKAVRDTGNDLVAALDPKDSVGIIDSYFPDASFFVEFERFDRHIDKLRRQGQGVDYVSICSPNYLHDAHIRFSLRSGAHAICEKPVVLNPWNLDALETIESETGKRVHTILQLRLHPVIMALRDQIRATPKAGKAEITLTYITSRGRWYYTSWKGDQYKSGGIATNIGVHFFDMLGWIFGKAQISRLHAASKKAAAGYLEFEGARVRWFLSLDAAHLPEEATCAGKRTFRSISIDDKELEFSEGFTDLHTESYRAILAGSGFPLSEARASLEIVQAIRKAEVQPDGGDAHPFARLI